MLDASNAWADVAQLYANLSTAVRIFHNIPPNLSDRAFNRLTTSLARALLCQ